MNNTKSLFASCILTVSSVLLQPTTHFHKCRHEVPALFEALSRHQTLSKACCICPQEQCSQNSRSFFVLGGKCWKWTPNFKFNNLTGNDLNQLQLWLSKWFLLNLMTTNMTQMQQIQHLQVNVMNQDSGYLLFSSSMFNPLH
jgi:hypothetical protein